jgi:hypothetical protein
MRQLALLFGGVFAKIVFENLAAAKRNGTFFESLTQGPTKTAGL